MEAMNENVCLGLKVTHCLPVYFPKGKIPIRGSRGKVWTPALVLMQASHSAVSEWGAPAVLPQGPSVFIQEAQDVVFLLDNNDRGFPIEITAWLPKMNENHKRDIVRLALIIKQVH